MLPNSEQLLFIIKSACRRHTKRYSTIFVMSILRLLIMFNPGVNRGSESCDFLHNCFCLKNNPFLAECGVAQIRVEDHRSMWTWRNPILAVLQNEPAGKKIIVRIVCKCPMFSTLRPRTLRNYEVESLAQAIFIYPPFNKMGCVRSSIALVRFGVLWEH